MRLKEKSKKILPKSYWLKEKTKAIDMEESKEKSNKRRKKKLNTSSESEEDESYKEGQIKLQQLILLLNEQLKDMSRELKISQNKIEQYEVEREQTFRKLDEYRIMLKTPREDGNVYDEAEEEEAMEADAVGSIDEGGDHEVSEEDANGRDWCKVTGRDNQYARGEPSVREGFPALNEPTKRQVVQQQLTRKMTDEQKRGLNVDSNVVRGKGKVSPPTIKLYNTNVKYLAEKIEGLLGHKMFNFKIMNKNMMEMRVNDKNDHAKVGVFLKNENINYYTYTPSDEKPITVVIKGLCGVFEVGEVERFFAQSQIQCTVKRIIKLNGDRWLVQFSHDSDMKSVFSIQYMLHCGVRIERHKRGGLVQCRNCQRYGHVSTNCSMQYRCVKCSLPHGPGNCKVPKKEENIEEFQYKDQVTGAIIKRIGLPVKCANCDREGHVASSQMCPKRRELKKRLDERRAERVQEQKTPVKFTSSYRTNGKTYASAALGGNARGTAAKYNENRGSSQMKKANAVISMMDAECVEYLGKDLVTCMDRIGAFAEEYSRIERGPERTRALFGLMISLRLDA